MKSAVSPIESDEHFYFVIPAQAGIQCFLLDSGSSPE
jgi:hypothetical protein